MDFDALETEIAQIWRRLSAATYRFREPTLRRALEPRDGGCRFPGCDRTRRAEGHHVIHWAETGETNLPNLITLCTFHHRLVYRGAFGVSAIGGVLTLTRPDGTTILAVRPGALARRRVEAPPADQECFRGNILASLRALDAYRVIRPRPPPGG